jgi:hypothetical protein
VPLGLVGRVTPCARHGEPERIRSQSASFNIDRKVTDISACNKCFAMQSVCMETKWAVDNLQTIRTLMERSALYRRALAPIMILAGTMGIAAGLTGRLCRIESNRGFVCLWVVTAIIALAGALVLMRRQALKDSEPFWSPPARRVCQALLPAFFVGLMMACLTLVLSSGSEDGGIQLFLVIFWVLFYGCAVHAAGFFMPRGIRWLGWIFIIAGCVLLTSMNLGGHWVDHLQPHLLMGGIFGGLQLIYGIYLHFTEQKSPAA